MRVTKYCTSFYFSSDEEQTEKIKSSRRSYKKRVLGTMQAATDRQKGHSEKKIPGQECKGSTAMVSVSTNSGCEKEMRILVGPW